MTLPLLLSVFVVATCGLIYELVAGALASYLLGDSITQFSTVIGVYLFAMGVGSYLSRFIDRNQLVVFVRVELLVGLLGGFSSTILFLVFSQGAFFGVALYSLVFLIGVGVGLEIPLLMNILQNEMSFRDLVSKVLSFDYIGALVASVAFPILLLPHLGLIRTALLFGMLNVSVAMVFSVVYCSEHRGLRPLQWISGLIMACMMTTFVFGDDILEVAEASVYQDPVIYSAQSPYQRVVLTRAGNSLRLFLNGHLQFDSMDEYRYHEALVHVGVHAMRVRRHVLILGGGDGLAAREVLKYPDVESITLVDLDPSMTALFRDSPPLAVLNRDSLKDPRVSVVNADAFVWLRSPPIKYDFAIVDLPDPTNFSIGKLYTTSFYQLLRSALTPEGIAVVQSTSPLMARQSFWCVNDTLREAGFDTRPYHAYVPSFGEWGFILAGAKIPEGTGVLPTGLAFLAPELLSSLFYFPPDMSPLPGEINRLNNQSLVHYYEKDWSRYGL
jgi:spermidine synthase